tara:strand:+ start:72491 stop:73846 length:1356 start_codon:yes stop_codon:yes gene_type:complete
MIDTISMQPRFAIGAAVLIALTAGAEAQVVDLQRTISGVDVQTNDNFAFSVDVDQDILVVGSPMDNDRGNASGSAYVFEVSTGQQLYKLRANDGAPGDLFGHSIAIDDGFIVVGAPRNNDDGTNSGSVYIFDVTTGKELHKLTAADAGEGDQFGQDVAIEGNTIVIGAFRDGDNGVVSGSAYIFDALTWGQVTKLLPDDGGAGFQFGHSIAIDDGIIAIGSNWDDANGNESGSAYLFDASTHQQLHKLLATDGVAGDRLGSSIAIQSNRVLVGAPDVDDFTSSEGAAYLFDVTTGEQIEKLVAPTFGGAERFGFTVDINDQTAIIGAQSSVLGITVGSAYLIDTGTLDLITQLHPVEPESTTLFARSIASDGDTLAIGTLNAGPGEAYIYSVTSALCRADLNQDGSLDFFDVSAFLSAYNADDLIADFNDDGVLSFFDVSTFVQAYNAGCP